MNMANMTKRATGRPSKLTPETIANIKTALGAGGTIGQACAHASIHPDTYHTWIRMADSRGGLYVELRDAVRASIAAGGMSALAQIAKAGALHWEAAAWRVERSERILDRLDSQPDHIKAHEARRAEWDRYGFSGTRAERARKVDVLAHMEELFTVVNSCRAAAVLRYEFKQWMAEDPVFEACVQEAMLVCLQVVEGTMFRAATTPDRKGKLQATACFGILNAKTDDWGILKAQFYARNNAKLIDEVADTLLADLPPDVANTLRDRLDGLRVKASQLPPGSSLK
jgi:hypothetical protein